MVIFIGVPRGRSYRSMVRTYDESKGEPDRSKEV